MSWGLSRGSLHEAAGLHIGEQPFVKPLTPSEMRIAMFKASCQGNAWLRRLFMQADTEGYTGEDRYAFAAFNLALEQERRMDFYLRTAELSPLAPVFISEKAAEDIFGPKPK